MTDLEPPDRRPPDDGMSGPVSDHLLSGPVLAGPTLAHETLPEPTPREPALADPALVDLPLPPSGPVSPKGRPPNRALTITLLVSLGLHLAAVTAVLLLLHAAVPVDDTPDKATEVELVMEEHKGDANPAATPPPSPQASTGTPAERPSKTTPQPAETPSPPVKAPVDARPDAPEETVAPAAASSAPAPATDPAPAEEARATPEPVPPAAQQAPKITLSGTDSPSDAKVWGEHVIPASPDAVFHNRPPDYPVEAVLNGQHGTVVITVHVSPVGTAAGVDVVSSSGYVLLDRAAREAVLRWRFLPAVKGGEPVASDITMGFIFDND